MNSDNYLDEIRQHWRALLSATLGISAGVGIAIYPQSILAPFLLKEFGWSTSQFALLGLISLLALLTFPFVGRLIDIIGVRRIILVGVITYPASWAGYTLLDGSFSMYIALAIVQLCLGAMTTSIVYSKIVAQTFVKTRGLALSLMMSGPAIMGAIFAPSLTRYAEAEGWRAGYSAVALFLAGLGIAGFLLLPKIELKIRATKVRTVRAWADYRQVIVSPVFWLIFGGLALCNVPNVLHTSQMAIMLLDRGLRPETAATAISLFAIGVIGGRFACGLALDRFQPEYVAAIAMALPAVSLFLLALNVSLTWVIFGSMLFVGLSQGAEGDIGAYITMKYFNVDLYGTVYGLVVSNATLSTALGAALLSATLNRTGNFTLFLGIGSASIIAGSGLLLFLRFLRPARSPQASNEDG